MLFYAALILGIFVVILISLKGWQWVKTQSKHTVKTVVKNDYRNDFRQAWSDADDFVQEADSWTPYLVGSSSLGTKPNPFFFGGVVTSSILLLFASAAGWAIGGGNIMYAIIAFSVMAIVQIIQAVVSLSGDKGTGDLWEMKKSDRSVGSWSLLILLFFVYIAMSVIGSLNVGSQAHQSTQIRSSTLRTDLRTKESLEAQIKMIDKRLIDDGKWLSGSALRTKYEAARDESIRESWRRSPGQSVDERLVQAGKPGPKCGKNCQELKDEAAQYKALLDDAERKPTLQQQLSGLNSRLNENSGVSSEGVAWANRLEAVTGGAIDKDTASKSSWTVFQVIIAMLDFALWLRVGDSVGAARRKKYDNRAEAANAQLKADGYEERYKRASKEPEPAQISDDVTPQEASGETIISVKPDPDAVINASEGLKTIRRVFASLLIEDEDGKITRGDVYQAFKAERQAQGVTRHMGQTEFIDNLKRYVELREIRTQGGYIYGWKIGQEQKKEAEDVATA